ncbi:MAG: hypothetical protein RL100_516 [Actinomycetota bacterium]|jgi:hypothetical protein
MAKIEFTQTHLLIKLTPGEKFFGLHGDFKLPAALIRGAEVADKEVWKTLGLRLPGTGIPTLLAYGSFWRKAGWTFALWRSNSPALTLTLALGAGNRFKRLVISTENAAELADRINDAILAC